MTKSRLSVLYDVHRIAYLAQELVEGALDGHDLSGTEFALYSYLIVEGPVTVSEVARGIAAPLATTSKLLARVEERGHLDRTRNPEDGRSTLVELNDAGRAAHAAARPEFLGALRRVQESLGGAADDVRWALARLDDALAAAMGAEGSLLYPVRPSNRQLSYRGDPLTADEEVEVRRFIEWLRWQRQVA